MSPEERHAIHDIVFHINSSGCAFEAPGSAAHDERVLATPSDLGA